MAVTLMDYEKLAGRSNDPLFKGFTKDLLRASDLLAVVPFKDVDGLQVAGKRWQTLPTAGFRKLNAGYTESTGNTEDVKETLVNLGGDVSVDRVYTKAKGVVQNPLELQMQMKAQAIALAFNNAAVNGDQGVDPDSFEGVKKRVSNMPSRMTIWLDSNGNGTGTALDVLATSAARQSFLDALHSAVKRTNGTHFWVNENTFEGIGKALRREGLLDTTQDSYGRVWEALQIGSKKIILVDVGLKSDKTTEIILQTENPGGNSSSLYAVRIDTKDGLHGLQLGGTSPKPYDPLEGGEMETKPAYLRRIDWTLGLFNLSQYCICRIAGFKAFA